eukprot:4181169-Pyramimonas_sp.AAC.1
MRECFPKLVPSPPDRWASVFRLLLGKSISPDATQGYCVNRRPGKITLSMTAGDELWICVEKNYSTGQFIRCTTAAADNNEIHAWLANPLEMRSSGEIILPHYDDIQIRKQVKAMTSHAMKWELDVSQPSPAFRATIQKRGIVVLQLKHHVPRKPKQRPNPEDMGPHPVDDQAGPNGEAEAPAAGAPAGSAADAGPDPDLRSLSVDENGDAVYHDPEVMEALARALLLEEAGPDEAEESFDEWREQDAKDTDQDI